MGRFFLVDSGPLKRTRAKDNSRLSKQILVNSLKKMFQRNKKSVPNEPVNLTTKKIKTRNILNHFDLQPPPPPPQLPSKYKQKMLMIYREICLIDDDKTNGRSWIWIFFKWVKFSRYFFGGGV